ncbi:hypothetical protein BAW75_00325 [Micromonospora chalcea]|nr:hypothetical protein BAW75_00325 [Micromonospora chalcea]
MRNNLLALQDLFTDSSLLGIAPENCVLCLDPKTVDEVLDVVHRSATAAQDTLLIYFAGHGVLDGRTAELHLCLPDGDPANLHKTVRYADLRRLINASRCERKVVILDCCYSGSAINAMSDEQAHVAEQSRIEGTYVMTSTSHRDAAMAPADADYTAFTGELIGALASGLPDAPELIDVDSLYFHLRNELGAKNFPIPHQRSRNEGRKIVLARNRFLDAPIETANVSDPGLPELPVGHEAALWAPPPTVAADLAAMRQQGESAQADRLLDALAVRRPDQEVAALVAVLGERSCHGDVDRLLRAAALRSRQDLAPLLSAFHEMDLHVAAKRLIHHLADSSGSHIAAVARDFQQAGKSDLIPDLLDAAVGRASSAAPLVALITALWTSGLQGEVDSLLERNASRFTTALVVELGDAFRTAGREDEAFRLYARATEEIASREPSDVASIAFAMRKAGKLTQADSLLRTAVRGAAGDPVRLRQLFSNVAVLDAVVAENMLLSYWIPATAEEVGSLARLLREAGHHRESSDVCARAAVHLSAAETLSLVERLREEGRPLDANRMLNSAGGHSPRPHVAADLLALLSERGKGADFDRLIAILHQEKIVKEVLSRLLSTGRSKAVSDLIVGSKRHGGGLASLLLDNDAALVAKILEWLNPASFAQLLDEVGPEAAPTYLVAVRPETVAALVSAENLPIVSGEIAKVVADFMLIPNNRAIAELLDPASLAGLVTLVGASRGASLIRPTTPDRAVKVLTAVSQELAARILEATPTTRAREIIEYAGKDQAVSWLRLLPERESARMLTAMPGEEIVEWLQMWSPEEIGEILVVLPSDVAVKVLTVVRAEVAAEWLSCLGVRGKTLFSAMPWGWRIGVKRHMGGYRS